MNKLLDTFYVVVTKDAISEYRKITGKWDEPLSRAKDSLLGSLSQADAEKAGGRGRRGSSIFFSGAIGFDRVRFRLNVTNKKSPCGQKRVCFLCGIYYLPGCNA